MRQRRLAVTFLVLVGLVVGGCSLHPDPNAGKHSSWFVHLDPEPLQKRWPSLHPESVMWMSGDFGNDRSPGPSATWIDAIVLVSDEEMSRLVEEFDLQPVDPPKDVDPTIQVLVPDDPLGSPELNSSMGAETPPRVFVYPDSNKVLLLARFPN